MKSLFHDADSRWLTYRFGCANHYVGGLLDVSEIAVTIYTSAVRINLCLSVKTVRVKVMYFFK